MNQNPSLRIPGHYVAKLLFEVAMLCLIFFLTSTSSKWLPEEWSFAPTVRIILHFFFVFFAFSLLLRFLSIGYRRRKQLPFNKKDNVTVGLTNIFMMVIVIYGLVAVFSLFGIRFSQMFTSLSIGAAAIAIILKDFVADVISGILITFSNEIKIDDHVKIGELRGKIIDINITKTTLLNDDDDLVFLPNNKVFSAETINYSKKPLNRTSIDFEVAKGQFSSVRDMENALIDVLADDSADIAPESYRLQVVAIHKDYLALKFQYQLNEFDRRREREIREKAVRYIVDFTSKVN